MPLTDAWIGKALTLTGGIETEGDPFRGVSGDFDKMGISCGCLQWNIGSNSLQPLVKPVGLTVVTQNMPTYGSDMWNAVNTDVTSGLAIVRSWQTGAKLKPVALKELGDLMGSPEMRQRQIDRVRQVATSAYAQATTWAGTLGRSAPTLREFCWFFDLLTQNGGLKGLKLSDVQKFINNHGATAVDDAICDFMAARTKADSGYLDSKANATLWRNNIANKDLNLFVLSYLRSLLSRTEYRGLTMNRKGGIAAGAGWINRSKRNLSAITG